MVENLTATFEFHISLFSTGSLVQGFAPGLHVEQTPGEDVENCKKAMKVADDCLGIPPIISAKEMSNPGIPELAIMAYTVQFRKVLFILFLDLFCCFSSMLLSSICKFRLYSAI